MSKHCPKVRFKGRAKSYKRNKKYSQKYNTFASKVKVGAL